MRLIVLDIVRDALATPLFSQSPLDKEYEKSQLLPPACAAGRARPSLRLLLRRMERNNDTAKASSGGASGGQCGRACSSRDGAAVVAAMG